MINQQDIKQCINYLLKNKDFSYTYYVKLLTTNTEIWAIVLAWQGDFDTKENDKNNPYIIDDYCICGKVAYLPRNSACSDYDIDWIMPYDEKTGEVYDTETSITSESDIIPAINYWEKCWDDIKSNLNKKN